MEKTPLIVRTLCAECDGVVWHHAASHKHYTHKNGQGACPHVKVTEIKMDTVQWR